MPYIEYWGPPGSGKTTSGRKLLAERPELRPGCPSLCSNGKIALRFKDIQRQWPIRARIRNLFSDASVAFRFWLNTRHAKSTRRLLFLMAQARFMSADQAVWVLDQGLQQHILTALAYGRLSEEKARNWCKFFQSPPFGAAELIAVTATPNDLRRQIQASPKHRQQAGKLGIDEYALRFECAFSILYNEASRRGSHAG
ncbi:MAG: hypothetical protein JJU08_08945 [Rhodobacteraceae bacterium]|nr:hypothetical protein [Paracoccaceae bacterium]